MSDLNVDDIIADPDLGWFSFSVIRQQQTIDAHGRSNPPNVSGPSVQVVGCVQPASGRALNMVPDLVNVSGSIEIWTRFRLEGPSDTTQPDFVLYCGRTYIVRSVQPWIAWGAGFIHAVCELYDLTAQSPAPRIIDYGP